MEKDSASNLEIDTPLEAGSKSFFASMAINISGLWAFGLAFDKVVHRIPFKEKPWTRIKDGLPIDIVIAAAIGLWDARKSYKKAETQQLEVDKLIVQNHIYEKQLKDASIEPTRIIGMHKQDLKGMRFEEAGTKVEPSQVDQLIAENQDMRNKTQVAADLMEYVADNIDKGVDPTKASAGFDAEATHAAKVAAGQETPPVEQSATRVMSKLNIAQPTSHGEKIAAEKAAAAEAEHSVA